MLEVAPDKSAANRRLAKLKRLYPLPQGCALRDVFMQRVIVGKLELFMVGLIADAPAAASVTGSAADSQGFPVDRAFFELVERLSIFLARSRAGELQVRDSQSASKGKRPVTRVFPADATPNAIRTSLSNGVALHESWPKACAAALCELVERDRVLRSFRGEFAPRPVAATDRKLTRALSSQYEIAAYEFGPRRKTQHTAAGLFLFPRKLTDPLAFGFAAALNAEAALARATAEALQRLAFLWGEEIPTSAPMPAPSPDYHQEHYLFPPHQQLLRAWLAGHWPKRRPRARASTAFDGEHASFVDLTPRELQHALSVAKAASPRARVLRFGASRPQPRTPPHPLA
jgi:hypothetical protein